MNTGALVLIHGTFASDADWIKADSDFSTSLNTSGRWDIFPFVWSGKNSNDDRVSAASDLRDFLNGLVSNGYRQFAIIAHSHGGNVLRSALDDSIGSYVKTCIYLGTPFINYRKFSFQRVLESIDFSLQICLFSFLISIFLLFIDFLDLELDLTILVRLLVTLLLVVFYIFACTMRGPISKLEKLEARSQTAFGVSDFVRPDEHAFSIYGDEALIGLQSSNAVFSFFGRIGVAFLKFSIEKSLLLKAYLHSRTIWFWIFLGVFVPSWPIAMAVLFSWSALVAFTAIVGLVLFLLGILPDIVGRRLTYGREPIIRYFILTASTSALPPREESRSCHVYKLSAEKLISKTLKHSLYYSDKRVSDTISALLSEQEVNRSTMEIESISPKTQKVERKITTIGIIFIAILFIFVTMLLFTIGITYNSAEPNLEKTFSEVNRQYR